MALTERTPFVVFGDDWGRYVSTLQHTVRHLALRYPVVWVNAIGHRLPRLNSTDLRRSWEKARAMVRVSREPTGAGFLGGGAPVAVIEPRVLPWHNLRIVHAANTMVLVRSVKRRLDGLGLRQAPVLVTASPPSVGVVGRLGEIASVYFCQDDFLHFPTVSAKMIGPLERLLLERVDAVVATAESLTRSKVPRSGRIYYLPQGVNYEHFATPQPEPDDLRSIPAPRIGFAGSVSPACDVALIRTVATALPESSVVLVGPVSLDRTALEALQRPNIYLLGTRPYRQLPAYVQRFDVGMIPYVLNDWTRAVDPLKQLEYLAAGIPVVCTAIPEAAKYRDVVTVAPDAEAFVQAVQHAIASDRGAVRTRGRALARRHTWKRRTEELLGVIAHVAAQRAAGPTTGGT